MRSVRSVLTALAAGAIVLGGAGAASADVNVDFRPQPSYTIVFGDWLQFAADDVFNAGHDNTVGSNN
ncbi:chaplin [Streptomyces sp. NPDC048606]|uniref:chaplin n=1 Tax=Streptomyces sp. NPDC048606 TaxID=3154726 RepID=UPI003433C622